MKKTTTYTMVFLSILSMSWPNQKEAVYLVVASMLVGFLVQSLEEREEDKEHWLDNWDNL